MNSALSDVAKLQLGFYAKPDEEGNIKYLQAKHFTDSGELLSDVDTFINVSEKNESHLLKDGDLLFAGKGFRNFAWTYFSEIGDAVASSIFFVIRPDKDKVYPEFLTTLFNTPKYQAYFQSLGAGSSITSIRKSELEAMAINLPSLEVQKKIMEIKKLHQQDLNLSKEIIEKKETRFQSVVNQLLYFD